MEKEDLIRKASHYVAALFKEKLSKKLVYHNYKHTFEVVREARSLAEEHRLPEEEMEILLLAAWFHDTGYINTYKNHEDESVEFATTFLRANQYPEDKITEVARCIMATKSGQLTHQLAEDILVDADISNIGKPTFFAQAELLRVEWEIYLDQTFSDIEWAQYQLDFLLSVTFRTQAAQNRFSKQLNKNIQEQRAHQKELTKKSKKKEKEDRKTLAQPKRGIETMFKSTYDNHISLSAIADNKANMMISLNAIIMSIIITYLGTKSSIIGSQFTRNPVLMIPVGILLATSLASVISAIISAQPEVTSFRLKPNKLKSRRINLLFFGNFTKIPLDDFQSGMHEIMRDKNALYNNMITDIYYLGDVLSKKYRLLRISYTIFMIGIILTVVSFVIAIAR
ncbi:HD domain-containing protein [Nibribacter ruber]|uniref:HD domain-containing protein n=1 Tax=Nibribacter ruber TaxID=2698458 RepID=A0A6P1P2D2_9BACT|nr:Pycsar system effector family protein [Nibribacter ruber]QHL88569.1 HD domain-containing protein [Nibribacter ruber]